MGSGSGDSYSVVGEPQSYANSYEVPKSQFWIWRIYML